MLHQPIEVNSPVDSILTASAYSNNDLIINSNKTKNKDKCCDSSDIGWFQFQPNFLKHFMNARWALFWLCWGGALQGLLVNGFTNVVITTIERRFGLRSSQTGLVASAYDIASFICLAPVTYFGGRSSASKPRWIAWGIVIMGLGSFIFALPQFIVGRYRATGADINICSIGNSTSERQACSSLYPSSSSTPGESENISWNVWVFFIGQILNGVGASPLFTLGVTYIDENVSKKMSSVYLGVYYTLTIIGPAVGYVLGGQLLQVYTDFYFVDPNSLGLTPQSKVWVGAWWIPFIFAGVLCLLLAIPMGAYPKSLPGAEKIKKVSEAHGSTRTDQNFTKFKEMPKALFALLRNPTFCFLNLAGASEGMIIAGFSAFLPKLIENQFSVTAVWASVLMGMVTVPAGGGGTFLGGYLVKKFKLQCGGILKLCILGTSLATIFSFSFFLSCPNPVFAGVTSKYFPSKYIAPEILENASDFYSFKTDSNYFNSFLINHDLESACNSKCKCSSMNYDPVCGRDGVMYYSPCHAGCSGEINLEKNKVYTNCTCIDQNLISNMNSKHEYDAINTVCDTDCNNLWKFSISCFFIIFFTFLASMPSLSATLRCVQEEQRSFALGIQWIKVRLLGTIPSPMIFGFLIDASCILWQESCDGSGSCLVYNNKYMSLYMMAIALIGKACSIFFFFGAWWYYVPPEVPAASDEGSKTEMNNGFIVHDHSHSQKY